MMNKAYHLMLFIFLNYAFNFSNYAFDAFSQFRNYSSSSEAESMFSTLEFLLYNIFKCVSRFSSVKLVLVAV